LQGGTNLREVLECQILKSEPKQKKVKYKQIPLGAENEAFQPVPIDSLSQLEVL
jgi:hypothetical protein